MKSIVIFILTITIINGFSQFAQTQLIYGVFNIYKENIVTSNSIQTRNSASAYFTYTPVTSFSPGVLQNVGYVKLNNKKLKFHPQQKYYGSKLKINNNEPDEEPDECNNTSIIDPMHWKVKGEGSVPKMNFIYESEFPSLVVSKLPNLIHKTDTVVIEVSSINNADSISVDMWDNFTPQETGRVYLSFRYKVSDLPTQSGKKIIKIAPQYFSLLSIGNKAYINVSAYKRSYQIVSGKNFLFNTYFSIIKPITSIIN